MRREDCRGWHDVHGQCARFAHDGRPDEHASLDADGRLVMWSDLEPGGHRG